MARSSRAAAAAHHAQIETVAARLIREKGIQSVSIGDVMSEVRLTHGGFYKHFESKTALMTAACAQAFEEMHKVRLSLGAHTGKTTLANFIEQYLSSPHRAHPGRGCPVVALAADAAREPVGSAFQNEYIRGTEQLAEEIERMLPGRDDDKRSHALFLLSTIVGALTLARATFGSNFSDEILSCTSRALLIGEKA